MSLNFSILSPFLYSGGFDGILSPAPSDCVSFIFLFSGKLTARSDAASLDCAQGGYVFLPRAQSFTVRAENAHIVCLRFMPLVNGKPALLGPAQVCASDEACSIFEQLAPLSKSTGADSLLKVHCLIYSLLSLHGLEHSGETAKIYPGAALLEEKFLENIPVSDYAAACGISENSFRSLFTKTHSLSPVEYRNRLRLEYAKKLITELSMPVAEASAAAGFASPSYFCRIYKKTYGVTPAKGERNQNGKMG